ncbi:MAG: ABC transporter substrate-binding protein, partial [Pigmentiphaga sp.]
MIRPFKYLTQLTLGACLAFGGPAMAASDSWSAVEAAAKREGKVVLYTSAVGATPHRKIAELFEARYGIPVEVLEARGSELRERIRAEQAAGRAIGDVQHNGTTSVELMRRDGNLQPHGGLPNTERLVAPFDAGAERVASNAQCYGILVNRRLVGADTEFRSWKDLTDPRWKGKIISDDMRALGGGSVFFFVMQDEFGQEFHEAMARQELVFSRQIRNDERRVARGEYAIYIPELMPFYTELKGLPVEFIVPEEGCPYVGFDISMLKDAPHPNAARLLMNFFLEPEAQLEFAKAGFNPV